MCVTPAGRKVYRCAAPPLVLAPAGRHSGIGIPSYQRVGNRNSLLQKRGPINSKATWFVVAQFIAYCVSPVNLKKQSDEPKSTALFLGRLVRNIPEFTLVSSSRPTSSSLYPLHSHALSGGCHASGSDDSRQERHPLSGSSRRHWVEQLYPGMYRTAFH